MSSGIIRVVVLAAGALELSGCAGGSERPASVAELRAENERLRGRVAELEARLGGGGADELAGGGAGGGVEPAGDATREKDAAGEIAALEARNRRLERLAGLTPMERGVDQQAARIVIVRGAADGDTRLSSQPLGVDFGGFTLASTHTVAFGFTLPAGAGGDKPGPMELAVTTYRNRGRPYRNLETAGLTLDGTEERTLPVAGYETLEAYPPPANTRAGRTRYDDRLTLTLDGATADRLATADDATLRLGGTTLPLSREHLAMFRAVLERHRGATPPLIDGIRSQPAVTRGAAWPDGAGIVPRP